MEQHYSDPFWVDVKDVQVGDMVINYRVDTNCPSWIAPPNVVEYWPLHIVARKEYQCPSWCNTSREEDNAYVLWNKDGYCILANVLVTQVLVRRPVQQYANAARATNLAQLLKEII